MAARPTDRRAALALAALAALALSTAAATDQRPLTNEDIVRLVMTGTDEKAILRLLEERRVDFDLDTEIVTELRTAGVNDAIIEAMRRRQAAMPRPAIDPAPAPADEAAGILEIALPAADDGADGAERSVIAARSLPKGARRPPGLEVGLVDDLAFAVMCTTGHHVPDHWEARTPIEGAPRHGLLLFEPGAAAATKKGFEILYLDHPGIYRLEVPEGRHALQFAVAGRGAGSGAWRLLVADGAPVSIEAGAVTRVTIESGSRLRGSYRTGFGLDVRWKVAAVGEPGDGPP